MSEQDFRGIDESFGAAVRTLRESNGWSQSDLAARIARMGDVEDASQVLISRIESGKRAVRLSEARALSRVFRISIEEMVTESDAVRSLAVRHRRARTAYVEFRDATRRVAEWQGELRSAADLFTDEVVEMTETVENLLHNVENFVDMDLGHEAEEIAEAVANTRKTNQESRGGRFLNTRKLPS